MDIAELVREEPDAWNTVMFMYSSALKKLNTKVEVLSDEFQYVHKYNPIEYVKSRLKTPDSIMQKIKRKGYEDTIESIVTNIDDIAGIRIVCSFTPDIYKIAEMIGMQSDLKVLSIKDYIKKPKESGYKSFHMNVQVPVFIGKDEIPTNVEIQIRTIAMDFWASLEHKIYYKFEGHAPEYISQELRQCASIVSMLDDQMLSLNEAITKAKEEQKEEKKEEQA